MDRFMDNADPQKKHQSKTIQSELNACRERVRLLVEGKVGDPFPNVRHDLTTIHLDRRAHAFPLSRTHITFSPTCRQKHLTLMMT